ncbi:MAG TPA: phosphomethylpyrimidine synthase ThiC [Nitrospirae bacterium]|nr:phosphomethylpyrimidine synthase [bacterium BMS3Bbin05]HDO21339.1 phosphomethylpyrimidine synthase ThiC [Nitrospirota bacterium]HDO36075.1 phosphomethylpyrimidine synthase ThiC [Nitrospirota bacterium]HDZ88171.1 phosphomethylpyrimidine synthase ThiC [Nitrospirota bacterium]
MTQIERAVKGEITKEMTAVAADEGLDAGIVGNRVASGKIVIPANKDRIKKIIGIGRGLRTKVNASIGTSTDIVDIDMEVEKARVAERYGADTLMDLSVGGDIAGIRKEVMDAVELPVGTVPLYEAFATAIEKYGAAVKMPKELLFEVTEKQCEEGVGFMAIHCGINRRTVEMLRKQSYRYGGLVSKGGSYMVAWMEHNNMENPLYEHFDRVVEILKKHDVVLSLGNGFRAGAIHDSTDRVQIQELLINCELAEIGRGRGCQTMVEGPGHIPIDEIEANVILEKRMSGDAPFYMLGPITTDIAPGYDHIAAAIGAALSSAYGADFICYVTPSEHLGLPFPEDVREGVMAARVAAHAGDMIKLGNRKDDKEMSRARRDMDWQKQYALCIDSERAKGIKARRGNGDGDTCTMCGSFCANNILNGMFENDMEGSDKK